MTFDYSELAANATEILTEFGRNVTRRSYTVGNYNPATGSTAPVTADTTRKGATFDFGSGKTFHNGNLIQADDKRLLLDADATISPQDHFIIGGKEYVTVSVGEINPAGTVVLYDIHLRNG